VPSRFTFDEAAEGVALWAPDGTAVLFASNRDGVFDLFKKAANGAADEQPLLVTLQDKAPLAWSADGRFLLYATQNPRTRSDLWAVPVSGE